MCMGVFAHAQFIRRANITCNKTVVQTLMGMGAQRLEKFSIESGYQDSQLHDIWPEYGKSLGI